MEGNRITRSALRLPSSEKRELIDALTQSIIAEEHAVSVKDRYVYVKSVVESVLGREIRKGRLHEDVIARMYISFVLKNDGFSYTEISRAIGKNHSTVFYMVRKVKDMLSLPVAYRDENEFFNKVKGLL